MYYKTTKKLGSPSFFFVFEFSLMRTLELVLYKGFFWNRLSIFFEYIETVKPNIDVAKSHMR